MGGLNQSLIRGDQLKVVALSDGQVQGIGARQSSWVKRETRSRRAFWDSSEKSSERGEKVKVAPPQRKESREGVQARSRIPAPTFYKTSSATDSRL